MKTSTLALISTPLLFGVAHAQASPAKAPNVILVMTDDQGYGDVAAHGNPITRTPNIDRMAGESINLSNFHVNAVSAPTRSALLTGRYATRVGVSGTFATLNYLNTNERTMGDIFRSMGYKTGLFGKWHLGGNYPLRPMDRGFDEWVGHGDGGGGTTNDYWSNTKWDDHYLHNGEWEPYKGFMTDIFFDEAMKYMDKTTKEGKPFFVYLPTNVPHRSWNTPIEWTKPYTDQGISMINALFYASVERADYNLGRLRQYLADNGLEENTILIFMSDNGTDNQSSYNAGQRGRKGSVYEGGHHVSCIIHWPERWGKEKTVINTLASHIDLLPTLINLCGVEPQEELPAFDGVDITPVLDGKADQWPDRSIMLDQQQSRKIPQKNAPHVVMTQQWRLVNDKELYDMSSDPSQEKDIAAQHPDVVAKLNADYKAWWDDVSVNVEREDPVIVGSPYQEEIFLTGLDWQVGGGDITWAHGYARKAKTASGKHLVEVATPGTYEFQLYRWPKEAGLALRAPAEPLSDEHIVLLDSYNGQAAPGVALQITKARLIVDGEEQVCTDIDDEMQTVIFEQELDAGRHTFESWFSAEGKKDFGAYYLYIKKK